MASEAAMKAADAIVERMVEAAMSDRFATTFETEPTFNIRAAIADAIEAAGDRLAKEERAHEQTIQERDDAEQALSQAYFLIVGRSPEWSNLFGHTEALQEIDDAQRLLREAASAPFRSDTRPPRNVAPLVERNGKLCAPKGCVVDEEGVVKPAPIGRLPKTADGVEFGLSAEVHIVLEGVDRIIHAGVLGIESPDDKHEDDYEEGCRWDIHVRDGDGEEWDVNEGSCYSTKKAAEAARGGGA